MVATPTPIGSIVVDRRDDGRYMGVFHLKSIPRSANPWMADGPAASCRGTPPRPGGCQETLCAVRRTGNHGMLALMQYVFSASDVSCEIMVDGERHMIFDDVSFAIASGEIVDLIGPSGSGKSSLLTAFAKLNPRAHGDFVLQGRPASDFTPQQWRAQVAYLPQKPVLLGDCVADAIRLPYTLAVRQSSTQGDGRRGRKTRPADLLPDMRIREMLDALGCADIDLDRPPHDLSGGQAARVSLARTLLTNPTVLLADEVDAGLDDENADKVATILKHAAMDGMAVIRIRHRPPDGRATRIMRLADGVLTQVKAESRIEAAKGGDIA